MPKAALYADPSLPLERIGLQLDARQLAKLDDVCRTRFGGNRAVGARAALIIGLEVLEDSRTLGLNPAESLAVYTQNHS